MRKSDIIYFFTSLVALWLPNLLLSFTEGYPAAQIVANLALPLGLYILAIGRRKPGRNVLLLFPVLFVAAFQDVLLSLFGDSVIHEDMFLNLITTNPKEASEVLNGLGWSVVAVVLLYGTVIVWACIIMSRRRKGNKPYLTQRLMLGLRRCAWCLSGIGIAAIVVAAPANPIDYVFPLNAFKNAYKAIRTTYHIKHYDQTSADYQGLDISTHPDSVAQLYIVIIGETSRAHNWQLLGYERETTPRLLARSVSEKADSAGGSGPALYFWRHALSGSNTTHRSVPMLLSGVTPQHYDDSIHHVKSFINDFRRAGFHTAVISAQEPNKSFIEFFLSEADTTLYISHQEGHAVTDLDLLPFVTERVHRAAPRQLIVVHSYGSHYDYIDRYPRSMAYFTPDGPTHPDPKNREPLVNAYDNTIRLTDLVVDSIITLAEQRQVAAAVMFTSDHGEDLYDDSRQMFMHAGPKATRWQLEVPMLVWFSEEYRRQYPQTEGAITATPGDTVVTAPAFYNLVTGVAGLHRSGR